MLQRFRDAENGRSTANSPPARATSSPVSSSRTPAPMRSARCGAADGQRDQVLRGRHPVLRTGARREVRPRRPAALLRARVTRDPGEPGWHTSPYPNLVQAVRLSSPRDRRGSVEIVAVAREAGHRSRSPSPQGLGTQRQRRLHRRWASGACNVMRELSDEKIGIIDYDGTRHGSSPTRSPAKVISVTVIRPTGAGSPRRGAGLPAVPGHRQEGQNARLAAPVDRVAHRHPQRCPPSCC